MAMLVISFIVLLLIVTAMSIGVLMGRKPITGSCGGVGAALGEDDYVCDICGGDESKCEQRSQGTDAASDKALAYDAAVTTKEVGSK
jgi:uncharacterized protein